MANGRKTAVKKLRNLYFSLKSNVKDFRARMENTFYSPLLPNDVECAQRSFSGIPCDVLSPELYSFKRVILYIHGGCFIGGSRKAYRPFVSSLAFAISARAVVPEFRLAPTHAYPASVEDVQNVFRALYTEELIANSLDSGGDVQQSRPEIVIAADGSGASIAMALVLGLEHRFRSSIKKIILFSPWLDVSSDSRKFTDKRQCDELYSGEAMRRAAELYTFQNNRNIPEVSILKATEKQLEGFPPVYIQTGDDDFLLDDDESFERNLLEAGGECTLDVWPDMPAMFELADECFEEAHLAVDKIGRLFTMRKVDKSDSQTEIQLELERKERNEV